MTIPRRLVVALALALMAAMVPSTGHADTWSDTDPDNANMTYWDIWQYKLDNKQHRAAVAVDLEDFSFEGGGMRIFFDTRRHNAGPEFVLTLGWGTVDWDVKIARVKDFDDLPGAEVDCDVYKFYATNEFAFGVPRGCLKTKGVVPSALRIALTGITEKAVDWAPGSQVFGKWVQAG